MKTLGAVVLVLACAIAVTADEGVESAGARLPYPGCFLHSWTHTCTDVSNWDFKCNITGIFWNYAYPEENPPANPYPLTGEVEIRCRVTNYIFQFIKVYCSADASQGGTGTVTAGDCCYINYGTDYGWCDVIEYDYTCID